MKPNKLLSEYCENGSGLEIIKRYFEGLYYNDILELSNDDLLNMTETGRERVLMSIFIKRYIYPQYSISPYNHTSTTAFCNMDKAGQISSSCYKGATWGTRINIVDLVNEMKVIPQVYNRLDLSNNNLLSVDIKYLVDLIETKDIKINTLILNGNRFQCNKNEYVDLFIKIIDAVDCCIIIDNPIASIDSKDTLFQKLTIERVNKLIWIPKKYFYGKEWQICISQDLWDITESTHIKFYQSNIY